MIRNKIMAVLINRMTKRKEITAKQEVKRKRMKIKL